MITLYLMLKLAEIVVYGALMLLFAPILIPLALLGCFKKDKPEKMETPKKKDAPWIPWWWGD